MRNLGLMQLYKKSQDVYSIVLYTALFIEFIKISIIFALNNAL
jgi:hypothetical protein